MGSSVTIRSYRPQVEKKLVDTIWRNMEKVGLIVERQAKINTKHPNPSGDMNHPWTDTGRLSSSITHWVYAIDSNTVAVDIGSNVLYGKYLELGWATANGSYIYPWLFPAVQQKRDEIKQAIGNYSVSVE
jgi:hypothetical protein